jgi:glutamate racemase
MRVGVFDSGLGGLSILGAIQSAGPHFDFAYCCDNLNFPYGTKTEDDVVIAATAIAKKFSKAINLDLLVIACNTASVVALDSIRREIPIPVVGVVPAVKPAAAASRNKFIGILATPVTIKRPYLDQLVKDHASDCKVIKCGSSKLVAIAEAKMRGMPGSYQPDLDEIRAEIMDISNAASLGLDQLVLGCTHFPLIASELKQVLPSSLHLLDSGEAIAKRVMNLLSADVSSSVMDPANRPEIMGFCSGEPFTVFLPQSFKSNTYKIELHKLT